MEQDKYPDTFPFQAYVELLCLFLTHRDEIVARIEELLNAQRKPLEYRQDRPGLWRHFEDCCFSLTAVTDAQVSLRGRLEAAHRANGFRPRRVKGLVNDLVNPAEMMVRAFYFWQRTRWPGRNGRARYAQTLLNVYFIRCLQLLSMRLWDQRLSAASDRLAELQTLLDALWDSSPDDQPVLVRDARWLIPLAQSPTTDELAGYFEVAERVAESLAPEQRIEIQKASVRVIGGHLTSQIRHYCMQDGVGIDAPSVVLRTRTSNALDFALLIQGLVPLLDAYAAALDSDDANARRALAGAICQGISADPELFLNRLELLYPYSMLEEVFVTSMGGRTPVYSHLGQRHSELYKNYAETIGQLAPSLLADCEQFRPVAGTYSPYGAIYGTPTNLIEDMTLKSLQRDAESRYGLEDVFEDGDAARLAWVSGWRQLPHIDREVQRFYEYPQAFAEEIFDRIERELRRCVAERETGDIARSGRLFPAAASVPDDHPKAEDIPAVPVRYLGSSDAEIVAADRAVPCEEAKLLRDRREGYFLVSFETAGGWFAIKKNLLTEVLAEGRDLKMSGLPSAAASVLRLMCPDLVAQG